MDVRIPKNYVIPKSVLEATRKVHSVPSPVYKFMMDDLVAAIVSAETGDPPIVFTVPPYVLGFPLYDAETAARWMVATLEEAGFSPTLSRTEPRTDMDMWPDREGGRYLAFPYDESEYSAALMAPSWSIVVPA